MPTRWTNGGRRLRNTRSPGHRHVVAERIRHQIDLVPELGERPDAMKLAERRAAGLEERLGRDHQNAHDPVIFSRNRSVQCRCLSGDAGHHVRVEPTSVTDHASTLRRPRCYC